MTIKCPGKIFIENGKVKTVHQHTHEKETKLSMVDKFRKILTKKAIEKPSKPLCEIYLEETLNFTEASILYPFQSAETTMRKARAKNNPQSSKLDSSSDVEKQQSDTSHQLQKHYCKENIQPYDTTVFIMHQHSIKLLGRVDEIHVDSSISCKLDDNENIHLITILAMVKNQDYPLAFGLVKLKSIEVLTSFFEFIRDKAPAAVTPNNVLTNCDQNLQEALKKSFPEATIKVMWFEYASSVIQFAKDSGTLQLMKQNLFYLSSLKMILAIPLIPANYILPGVDSLKKWMFEKSVNFDGLCEFIHSTWLCSDGAEKISIFNGLSHSINNYVQIFNRELLQSFNVNTLTNTELLEAITKQATRAITRLNKTKATPKLKKSQKLQKTILETATLNWIKANIHLRRPIQFLQQVSHCIDDGMINFLINFDVGKQAQAISLDSQLRPIASPAATFTKNPPPLLFYKTMSVAKIALPSSTLSEPPPLVPILRKPTSNES